MFSQAVLIKIYVALDWSHCNFDTVILDIRKFQGCSDSLNQAHIFSNEELEEGISNRESFSQLSS